MRIAIFTNKFPVLSETFVIEQVLYLEKLGVKVEVLTNQINIKNEVMHSNVNINLLKKVKLIGPDSKTNKFKRGMLAGFNLMHLFLKCEIKKLSSILLDKYLTIGQKLNLITALKVMGNNTINYDGIICHFGGNGYYLCKARELGLISGPILTIFHGVEVSHYSIIKENMPRYKELFKIGDLMLPISNLWKDRLIEWGCPPSKIKVQRMGVDVQDFEMKNSDVAISDPINILQVGRLVEKKAILDSINAVNLASKKICVDFTIIGDGELYESAEALINSLGAESFIHLLGSQTSNVVKTMLDTADVFLLPSAKASNGDMEGIPVALMEAMAKGIIVLSTQHSGIPELIEHGKSGFLVEEHDIQSLANTLIYIKNMQLNEIKEIRNNAREKCENSYNNELLTHDLIKLITDLSKS